jgi:hypothetical protein
MSWFVLPLIGGGETILREFCSSALWQIYQTWYLLFMVQECMFITPSQDERMQLYNSSSGCRHHSALHGGNGILTHMPLVSRPSTSFLWLPCVCKLLPTSSFSLHLAPFVIPRPRLSNGPGGILAMVCLSHIGLLPNHSGWIPMTCLCY